MDISRTLQILITGMVFLLAACGSEEGGRLSPSEKVPTTSRGAALKGEPPPPPPAKERPEPVAEGATREPTRRYRAIKQFLTLELEPNVVEKAWKNAQEACLALPAGQCEILQSNMMRADRESPPDAEMDIRIAPERAVAFRSGVMTHGVLIDERTESIDKTDAVIDTEARLKNMAALRDRLRSMLATPGAKLKDLIELERELTRVQSDLDSLTTVRKTLANETEKIFIRVHFRARRSLAEMNTFQPVTEAFASMGRTFAHSLSAVILFIAGALPWVFFLPLLFFIIRAIWRRLRRKPALV